MIFNNQNLALAAAALLASATVGAAASLPLQDEISLLGIKLSQVTSILLTHELGRAPTFSGRYSPQHGVEADVFDHLTFLVKRGEGEAEKTTEEEKERMKNVTERSKDREQRMEEKKKKEEEAKLDMSNVTGRSKDRSRRMDEGKKQ